MSDVLQLGYLGFEVSAPHAWQDFATEILGLSIGDRFENGGFTLRMDRYPQRFFVEPGAADDVSVIGWQVTDCAALLAAAKRIAALGIEVTSGTAGEAAHRKVGALVKYRDPAGIASELFCDPSYAPAPACSPLLHSRFIANELGLGHVVVSAADQAASIDFYQKALGFRLSDEIRCEYFGHKVDIAFFHINKRHHSLAIGQQQQKRIHHFMIEVGSIDDVGLCFDRALRAGVPIMQTLGRHPNDRMFSFYAKTPSGFQFEFGHGGREVELSDWQPTTYDRISDWGHHPPIAFVPRGAKRS